MDTQTFKTYCPIFSGFYNTVFDESDRFIEYETDNETDFREHYPELAAVPFDFIRQNFWDCVNYQAANLAVAQAILDAVPSLFPGIVTDVKWEAMRSPREYNFANDSIDCEITVDMDALKTYLADNRNVFDTWLDKRYTSRSGFISSYPNDVEGWEEETKNFTELEGHYLGAILDFIASEEMSEPEMDLYYAANGSEAFSNAADVNTQALIEQWNESQETTTA
jgi:hypothetical protein